MKQIQERVHALQAEGKSFTEIAKILKAEGVVSKRTGQPYAPGTVVHIARYGSTAGPKANAAKASVKCKYKSRTQKRGVASERSVNELMRACLSLEGVDRDTKLALVELVAQL